MTPLSLARALTLAPLLAACLATSTAWAQNCGVRDAKLRGQYDGECRRGWANGQGKASGVDRYEGSFLDGQAHGQGRYTFADGSSFDGLFIAGQVSGPARFSYPNGQVLEGEFRNNRLVGVGRLQKPGGSVELVEMQGAVLLPARTQAAAPASPSPSAVPGLPGQPSATPGATPPNTPTPAAGPAQGWQPQLDFDDIFPSFILTTATRKPVAASRAVDPAARTVNGNATQGGVVLGAAGQAKAQAGNGAQARLVAANARLHYLGDHWGLVGVRLRNATAGTKVSILVSVDGVAEPTQEEFVLDEVGEYALYPKLRYRFEQLRGTVQPGPVNVAWSVWVDGQPRGSASRAVRLRSVNDVPFVLTTAGGVESLTWVFAGFVTEDAPWVPELLREAFSNHSTGALGYQGSAADVDAQVKAVYDMLKRRGVKYSSITDTAGSRDKVYSQFVRFPSESVRAAEANCVDGTVLMATLLKRIGIKPLIIVGPGHALLGYVRDDKQPLSMQNAAFVETTVIADAPFDKALQAGRNKVEHWRKTAADHPLFNVIEVDKYRLAGVMPIAR